MDPVTELPNLRQANQVRLTEAYRNAATAVAQARTDTDVGRWPAAAQALCEFLSVVQSEEALWVGFDEVVDAVPKSQSDLQITWDRLDEFIDAEFELLVRAGLDDDTAGKIVFDIRDQLRLNASPTHQEVQDLREDIRTVQAHICAGDFAAFGAPERKARNLVNSNAILAGGGGVVGVVTNAFAPLFPPFVAGSVVGGLAAAVAGFRSFTRRRRE